MKWKVMEWAFPEGEPEQSQQKTLEKYREYLA